jgi:cell division transport system permease protein
MKSVKHHLMFIFPLVAILLGIEFYMVFDRMTAGYEKRLKEGYTMLVVSKKPLTLAQVKRADKRVASLKRIEREAIVENVSGEMSETNKKEILARLPYFYDVGLERYLGTNELKSVAESLKKIPSVTRVETFGASYASAYKLFTLIKLLLKIFIGFMAAVSLLLILKQVEIWKYEHRERMQVMEIFGAPLMLRAGVLFRIAVIDAFVAALITTGIFLYAKTIWAPVSGIDLIRQKQDEIFQIVDMGLLLFLALVIVVISVYAVVISNTEGVEE